VNTRFFKDVFELADLMRPSPLADLRSIAMNERDFRYLEIKSAFWALSLCSVLGRGPNFGS
jgi:hypothetical protein